MDPYPSDDDSSIGHRSFVLRLRWDRTDKQRALRITIEDTETGEWQGFQNLGELLNFLFETIHER
jgi:hypothetical protein